MIKKIVLISFFIMQMIPLIAQVNLQRGLIAYYPFNGNTNDASGNNFNASNFGATLTTDAKSIPNRAFEFNGVNSNILLPYNNNFNFATTDSFSISCWIQPYNNLAWAMQALIVKCNFNLNPQNANWNYGLYVALDKAMSGYTGNNFLNGTTTLQKNSCWYHLVVTYKNGVWYLYVNGKIEAQDLTQTKFITQDASVTSVIAIGKKGSTNADYFNGKIDEVRIYNRNLSKVEVEALYKLENVAADFSFEQNLCNPRTISLNTATQNINKTYWTFGNGQIDSNKTQLQYTYTSFNTYTVQLITLNNFGCYDTVQKVIPVLATLDTTVIVNKRDTSICAGANAILYANSTNAVELCWSSSNNTFSASTNSVTVTPIASTSYFLTTKTLGNNLVVNGDFEQGNIGFQSDYTYFPGTAGSLQGIYTIGNNPNVWLSAFAPCTDRTPGVNNDKMLMVDGSTRAGLDFWKQTIAVTPNTNYQFSFWLQSIVAQNPAVIKVKIDGKQVGTSVIADFAACSWKNYTLQWHSENATSITLALEDSNLVVQGNDFAIDDITFNEVFLKQDSIRVTVKPTSTQTISQTICSGQSYNGNTTSGVYQNTFTNTNGCDSVINVNLTVLPAPITVRDTLVGCGNVVMNNTTYNTTQNIITSIKNILGCDSVIKITRLVVLPKPNNFITTNNITLCLGETYGITGFSSFLWNTGATTANISFNGLPRYWVEVTDSNGCKGRDTVNVTYSGRFQPSSINSFSPNGDGINEVFAPFANSGCLSSFNMIIFNRNGHKLFETNDASKGWDGKVNGKPAPVGVYYFIINYQTTTATSSTTSGTLTLVK